MVEQLNAMARLWWAWSTAMLWQVGLLIILIGCIDLLIRRWAWPQLRYALWSLILVKLLLPPTLSLPSGIVPGLQPVVSQAIRLMDADKPAAAESTVAMADFGLQIADLTHDVDSQPASVNLQFAGVGISDGESGISDSILPTTPHSALHIPQFAWQVYAMLIWLAGTLILGIWLFLRLHSFYGRHASQAAAASLPRSFYNQLADCANRLELRHVPRVVVTKRLASPAVFGALRPVLLMPKGYLSKLSRRDVEHMLLHELAHVKRGDLVMHSLYMLLQIAYWYNPLLWLVRRQMHHLRELSCDATVANLLRERTLAYRQTLLETARRLLAASVEPGLGLLGLFEDSNRLLVRLNWLTKPTWRYRTMKRTIVVAIAALMIACVLPMARAQESASNEVKHVVKDEIVRVNIEERDQPSRDQMSQDLKSLQRHLDQMMAQQRELQTQLQALAERRRATSSDQEHGEQLAQDLGSVQKHLDELTIQQKVLQDQLRALAGERRPLAEGRRERQRDPADGRGGGGRPGRERVEEGIDVTMPRDAPADVEGRRGGGRPGGREAPELRDEVGREQQERGRALDEAKRAFGEARETQAQRQRQYADRMKGWGAEMKQWEQSEPMQQWRRDIETWQKQVQEWAQDLVKRQMNVEGASADVVKPAPMPPMPPMPEMPRMPGPMRRPAPMRKEMKLDMYGGVEPRYEDSRADLRDIYGEDMPAMNVPSVELPVMAPPVPPVPPMPPAVPEKQENQEEAVSRVEQVIDLAPGQLLDVKNEMGSIIVRGSREPGCRLVVTVKGRAQTMEEARRIVDQVELIIKPSQDGVYVATTKPEKDDQQDHANRVVTMEIVVPHDARIRLGQYFGDIHLTSLNGFIRAVSNMGVIQATEVRGRVDLESNFGSIDFLVPGDFSAKVQAKSQMGSIQSDVPLEVAKSDGFSMGSKASGVIGGGEGDVSLKTNMGSIRIRSQASDEPGRAARNRLEPGSGPRPEPRREPRPEGEF